MGREFRTACGDADYDPAMDAAGILKKAKEGGNGEVVGRCWEGKGGWAFDARRYETALHSLRWVG